MKTDQGPFEVYLRGDSPEAPTKSSTRNSSESNVLSFYSSSKHFQKSSFVPAESWDTISPSLLKVLNASFPNEERRVTHNTSRLPIVNFSHPPREFDCKNYETCLSLAAALNWKSFSCEGCCGNVDQRLLWKAHHLLKNEDEMSDVCELPLIGSGQKTRAR